MGYPIEVGMNLEGLRVSDLGQLEFSEEFHVSHQCLF